MKIDTERLGFIINNQQQLGVDTYSAVRTVLQGDERLNIGDVGRNVIQPPNYGVEAIWDRKCAGLFC